MNKFLATGRLTKDVDLKYTSNGTAVGTFTLAVNRQFTNDKGEREADFIQCVVWRKPAETLANYTRKGSHIEIEARIQTRSYDNAEGKRVYVTEAVVESFGFLDKKSDSGQTTNQSPSQSNSQQRDPFEKNGQPIDIQDDDLPF